MKKRMIIVTITLLIVIISVSMYFNTRNPEERSLAERLPNPKPHEHVLPDGTPVEHIHNYVLSETSKEVTHQDEDTSKAPIEKKSPWVQEWEELDIERTKKDHQPYSVAEMLEMWDSKLLDPFGPNPPAEIISSYAEADRVYPRDVFLTRMLELGRPFVHLKDYEHVMAQRRFLLADRKKLENMLPSEKMEYFEKRGLPPDASWEMYEDYRLKRDVVHNVHLRRAWDANPNLEGGVTIDGVFMPFLPNTVHVHISEDSSFAQFTGVKLTPTEKKTLKMYGITPKGVNVIYVDENNKPLSPGTPPPRFYERNMKELEKSQALLQQQIADHELLLELDAHLTPSTDKRPIVISPHDHGHENAPAHTHEAPQADEGSPSKQRGQPPNVRQLPPGMEVPPDLHTQDDINRWFTALEAVHGGQLPKDLQTLQEVITELEQIRQDAEKNLKPPERPAPPAPPSPPEGSSHAPDEED